MNDKDPPRRPTIVQRGSDIPTNVGTINTIPVNGPQSETVVTLSPEEQVAVADVKRCTAELNHALATAHKLGLGLTIAARSADGSNVPQVETFVLKRL